MINTNFYNAIDWLVFRGATLYFLHGRSPYEFQLYNEFGRVFEAPWLYMLYSPFVMLPNDIGRMLLLMVSILVFGITAIKMKAKPWQLVMYLLSYPVLATLYQGNIDWLVTAGFIMPSPLGLFFILLKPQIGIGVAVFWLLKAWDEGGWIKIYDTFMPITFAYAISFVAYGMWMFEFGGMESNPNSVDVFPWLVPLGVYLLYMAGRKMKMNYAIMAAPFLSPYVSLGNFSGFLLGTLDDNLLFIVTWILLWIPVLTKIIKSTM